MMKDINLESLKAFLTGKFPQHQSSVFTLLNMGWDSVAVDVDDQWIYRFPRQDCVVASMVRECRVLEVIGSRVTLPVPKPVFYEGKPAFTCHVKIKGDHLLTHQYNALSEIERERLAGDLALLYAELHSIPSQVMHRAGAEMIRPFLSADVIANNIRGVVDAALMKYAEHMLGRWVELGVDPYPDVFGFFDGHGWNMAFDHASNRLNGVYDFGDSGFGAVHQEFIYSNFISPDLTRRIIHHYEILTTKAVDRERVNVLTAVHRLHELAEYAHDPEHVHDMIRHVEAWRNDAGV